MADEALDSPQAIVIIKMLKSQIKYEIISRHMDEWIIMIIYVRVQVSSAPQHQHNTWMNR